MPVRCLPRSHTLEAAVLQTSAYSAATVVLLTAEWDEGEAVRCVAVTGEGQVVDLDVTLHGALPMMRGHSMTHCGDGVFVTYGGSGQDGLIEVAHRLEVLGTCRCASLLPATPCPHLSLVTHLPSLICLHSSSLTPLLTIPLLTTSPLAARRVAAPVRPTNAMRQRWRIAACASAAAS